MMSKPLRLMARGLKALPESAAAAGLRVHWWAGVRRSTARRHSVTRCFKWGLACRCGVCRVLTLLTDVPDRDVER